MLVKMNEYLIEIENDIKKTLFLSSLENKLEERNFKIDSSKKIFYVPDKSKEGEVQVICSYELKKIYHNNKNTKNIFFVLELFYDLKNIDSKCQEIEDYISKTLNINRFRNYFINQTKLLEFVTSVIVLEDAYKFCMLQKSYSIIYNIENSMRSLITKTMSFLAKKDWVKSEIPENILSELRDDRKHLNVFGTDFSHLSKILFDRTGMSNIPNVLSLIDNLNDNYSETDIKKIKERVPKSNWKKYFSEIIIEDDLKEIKEELYKNKERVSSDEDIISNLLDDIGIMRNKIAHNNFDIPDEFYEELQRKSRYINRWIDNAMLFLDKKVLEESKSRMEGLLSSNEKSIIEKIQNLAQILSKIYDLDNRNQLNSYLFDNFCSLDEDERIMCEYKCIKDIRFFLHLELDILNENRKLSSDEFEKYFDDINELIKNVSECPKKEINDDSFDVLPKLNAED